MFSEVVKLPVYEILKRSKKLADVGIELEVEGKYLPETAPTGWSAKPEGSLQGGWEYVSKPMKAADVLTSVTSMKSYINTYGSGAYKAKVLPSHRCSTHIHVNMLPETFADLLGFVVIWAMFEPVLLSLCGPSRDGNLFCLGNYDTGDVVSSFERMCSTLHFSKDYGFSYERGKYAALNLGRLCDLGTAEARCFPLSLEPTQIKTWVDWLLAMKDLARAQPDKTYRELWKLVRQNPQWYAAKVFGMEAYSVPNLSSLVDYGTESAYEMTKVLKHWYNNKDAPKQKKRSRVKKIDPGINLSMDDFTVASVNLSQGVYSTMANSWQSYAPGQPVPQPPYPSIPDDTDF